MGRMSVVHVAVRTAGDYLARREPHRQAHIERLAALRAAGVVIAGGPAPDGRTADLFYRPARPEGLAALVEEDPYHRGGAWVGYEPRPFARFVEPWSLPPVVLDGSRRASLVEGPALDADLAQLALVELRGQGRLAFGGAFGDGRVLAVFQAADPDEAAGWLAGSGAFAPGVLRARPWLYVL